MKYINQMAVTDLQQKEQSIDQDVMNSRYFSYGKRILDLVICISSLILLLPLIAFISLLIVIGSPGSPIFIQERVGKNGKRFNIYKFRTMQSNYNSEADRAFMQAYIAGKIDEDTIDSEVYKPDNKSKITQFGKVLRITSLDELPQIINILKGEMSLIGPRPNVAWEVEKYLDWHCNRLKVLPGITGLAQIRGRSSLTFDDLVRHDLEYIENLSFRQDFHIMWSTILMVLRGVGAR
jgi:lipopolysaccharide/colanic/teichoic acid biosynthesis glycosyltransferase